MTLESPKFCPQDVAYVNESLFVFWKVKSKIAVINI